MTSTRSTAENIREKVLSCYPEWPTWTQEERTLVVAFHLVGSLRDAQKVAGQGRTRLSPSISSAAEDYFRDMHYRIGKYKKPLQPEFLMYHFAQELARIAMLNPDAVNRQQMTVMNKFGIQPFSEYTTIDAFKPNEHRNRKGRSGPKKVEPVESGPTGLAEFGESA